MGAYRHEAKCHTYLDDCALNVARGAASALAMDCCGLGLAFLVLFGIGFWAAYQEVLREAGDSNVLVTGVVTFFMLSGLYTVNFLIVMTTVLTAVGSISQEVSTNTIHAIAAKPLRRQEIFLGKCWVTP